jgi:hypothetical protein
MQIIVQDCHDRLVAPSRRSGRDANGAPYAIAALSVTAPWEVTDDWAAAHRSPAARHSAAHNASGLWDIRRYVR